MFRQSTLLSFYFSALLLILPIGIVAAASDEATLPGTPLVASYKLGPGDILEITVWKEEGLEKQVIVPPDGVITFPHAGSFKAEGMTIDQVRNELAVRLGKIIVDPVVTVFLINYPSEKVYVIGKVNKPGEFPLTGPVDVMQALAMAQGMATFADQDSILILRRVNGKNTAIPFDYSDVESGDSLEQNIILKKGDVVVVP